MGRNNNGQLGDGTTTQKTSPVQVPNASDVMQVSSGSSHTMFIKNGGTLWGTGRNNNGQLGDGTTTQKTTPFQVPNIGDVIQVSSGYSHTMFIKNDGTLWGMGSNNSGQLGDGTTTQKTSPVQVQGFDDVIFVCSGFNTTMFVKNDEVFGPWGITLTETLETGQLYLPRAGCSWKLNCNGGTALCSRVRLMFWLMSLPAPMVIPHLT